MENLVKGYNLLKSELHDYTIQDIAINSINVEIIAKSENGRRVKLSFEDVQKINIKGDLHGEVSIILYLDIHEIGDTMLEMNIVSSVGVNIDILSKKLKVTRLP
ncbi:MAG: hypothetical protein J6Y29_02775 [Clostridiales bacterium]|nr:hypothetical protein [Clostridiales bacterium]